MKVEKRNTRGLRLTQLVGEEAEADVSFWGQNAWNADDKSDVDEDFDSSSSEEADAVDSDFDEDEGMQSDGAENEKKAVAAERESKKRNRQATYREPVIKQRKKEDTGVKKLRNSVLNAAVKIDRSMRASTTRRTESVAAAIRAENALLSTMAPPKPRVKEQRLNQKDMLEEAAKTEIENTKSLEMMLMLAEEKRRNAMPKKPYLGAQVKFHSKKGCMNTVTFTDVIDFPKCINSGPIPYPVRPKCVVSGLTAKYKDPLTGAYYANSDAFKVIRSRYAVSQSREIKT